MDARETFPHVEADPGLGSPEGAARILRTLDLDAPWVRRMRRERNTIHLWIDGAAMRSGPAAAVSDLFVKVYRPPHLRNAVTPLLRSRARREYDNSRFAAGRSLPVVPALAYGERRRCGVVVDQFVAFADLGDVRSASEILRWGGTPESKRRTIRSTFAARLADLHDGGYLHLAASPRNLLRVRNEAKYGGFDWLWIDHPRAVVLDAPLRATSRALPDVLQALESELTAPDSAAAREFLEAYAPGERAFHERVLRLRGRGVEASRLAWSARLRGLWPRRGFHAAGS